MSRWLFMSFDPANLVVSFIVGSIGFVAFYYGKKMARFPHMLIGAAMMIFPFFVPNVWITAGISAALCGLLVAASYFDW